MIEKIKQHSKQKNVDNKNVEKNEKKPEEESSQEVIKVSRGGRGILWSIWGPMLLLIEKYCFTFA